MGEMDRKAYNNISYGLYMLSTRLNDRTNGCIVNTVEQVTSTPGRIAVAVNKDNLTNKMIAESGVFCVSILTKDTPFSVFQHFGFQSGRDVNKFDNIDYWLDGQSLPYLVNNTNAYISCKVYLQINLDTHTLFIGDVVEMKRINNKPSVTYSDYFSYIKPQANLFDGSAVEQDAGDNKESVGKQAGEGKPKHAWRCTICDYIYEGDELPEDFKCPTCKHGIEDFEQLY